MRLIDADKIEYEVAMANDNGMHSIVEYAEYEKIQDMPEVDAIPIGYIDQVIDEYEHMIEHYLYDDDEDLKEYLCYRNCLNNLKRRWKRDRPKLHL